MATAMPTTTNNDNSRNYRTVVICLDLPKIDKYYPDEPIKELPPTEFWIHKIDKKVDENRYKLQHVIVNGPCEHF